MDTSTAGGLAALLPFWILIAGTLVVAATSWFDPKVRDADGGRRRDDGVPDPLPPRGYRPNDVDPMR